MPEKARRRARRKRAAPADFAREKGKVGRAKRAPANETKPEFRTRRLAVAGQSVAKETAPGAAVSARNLTVPELLAQLGGHPSAKVRAEAAAGLEEVLGRAPAAVAQQLGPLLGALAPRALDPERPTRRAALRLLRALGADAECRRVLPAFLPVLMTATQAALTHVELPIRTDALGFLEALLEALPAEATTAEYWGACLSHFQDLLAPKNRHDSLKRRSLAFVARASACCRRYLAAADQPRSGAAPGGSAAWLTGARVGGLMAPSCGPIPRLKAELAAADAALALCAGCGAGGVLPARLKAAQTAPPRKKRRAPPSSSKKQLKVYQGPPEEPTGEGAGGLEARLLGTLVDCWAECHPAELLGEAAEAPGVQVLADLLMCMRHLACPRPGLRLAPWGEGTRARLLAHVAPHFPARVASESCAPETLSALSEFNLAAAEVLACLTHPGSAAAATAHSSDSSEEATWAPRVVRFYSDLISRGRLLEAEPVLGAVELETPPASPEMTSQALRAATMLLGRARFSATGESGGAGTVEGGGGFGEELIQAVAALLARISPDEPLFAETLGCLGRLLEGGREQGGDSAGSAVSSAVPASLRTVWLASVPGALWKMGSKEPDVSRRALRLSLEVLRRSRESELATLAEEIQLSLAPLFCAVLPPRLGTRTPGPRVVWGPLRRLPDECQALAAELLHFLPSVDADLGRAVLLACLSEQGLSVDCACRAVHALHSRALRSGEAAPEGWKMASGAGAETHLSFLVTLLAGRTSLAGSRALGPDPKQPSAAGYWDRHMPLLLAALQCVPGGRRGTPAGGALFAQSLLRHASASQHPTRRLLLGLILLLVSEMYSGVPLCALLNTVQGAGGEQTELPNALFRPEEARNLPWLASQGRRANIAKLLAEYALVTASISALPEAPSGEVLRRVRGPGLTPFFLALQGAQTDASAVIGEMCNLALDTGADVEPAGPPFPRAGPEDTAGAFRGLERDVRVLSLVRVLQGVCTRTPCLLVSPSALAIDRALGRLHSSAAEVRSIARGLEHIRGALARAGPARALVVAT